jgi:TonB-like protein
MKKINLFATLLPLCACLCLMAPLLHADDAPSDAKQLLQAAHEVSDLASLMPYELHATIVINPGTTNEKKGQVTIYRDHDRWRTELQIEGYAEIKMTVGSKLYILRSTPMPVPQLSRLADTDHNWDKLADDGDAKFSDVSKKKVQNQTASCFDVKSAQRHRLCFDPVRKVLLENLDLQRAIEYSDYTEVDHHFFPGKITVLAEFAQSEKPILVVQDIKVTRAQFTASSFAVPPRSLEFDTCTDMQPAKPLQTPRPEFSPMAVRRNMNAPVVGVYGIIGKDGNLQGVKVLNSDPEIQQPILEIVKKWHYTPAMCGSSPVATEKEIQIPLYGGGSGGDVESGTPRGR